MERENELIFKIIYREQKIKPIDIFKVDLSVFTKIASSHLIIPLIYSKIREKKIENIFPADFIKYYREIYKINKSRNLKMIGEVKELVTKLDNSKIEYMLIKGAALIIGGYYKDVGERMVGDIDFIIDRKNSEKLIRLLNTMNYREIKTQFFKFRHLPRRVNKTKLFAIEPHIKFTSKHNQINKKLNFNEKIFVNGVFIPKNDIMFLNNILSFQLNDNAYKFLNYSFKNLYDTLQIIRKDKEFDKDLYKHSCYVIRYFKIIDSLKIFKKKFISKMDITTSLMIFIKNNHKLIFTLYKNTIILIITLSNLPVQLYTFLTNKSYRKYLIRKIKKNYL
jgi:hypothetical protein